MGQLIPWEKKTMYTIRKKLQEEFRPEVVDRCMRYLFSFEEVVQNKKYLIEVNRTLRKEDLKFSDLPVEVQEDVWMIRGTIRFFELYHGVKLEVV